MKNYIKATSLISILSFSVFCFCYLNFSDASINTNDNKLPIISESIIDTEPETNEILLPDLRLVESASQFVGRLFKAL